MRWMFSPTEDHDREALFLDGGVFDASHALDFYSLGDRRSHFLG